MYTAKKQCPGTESSALDTATGKAELRNIQNVLQRRKAERGKHAVNHRVEPVVERRMVPRELHHHPALARLLYQRNRQEIFNHQPQRRPAQQHLQRPRQRALDHAGSKPRQCAEQHQLQKQPRRFFFDPVEPVDLHHQKHGRHQRGKQQKRTHKLPFLQ